MDAEPTPAGQATPAGISFHNANAVRAGFFTAIIVWVLIVLPVGGPLGMLLKLLLLGAGGFLAVIFYTRRTGEILSVASGARLGWITGVLFYVIWILFFTVTLVVVQQEGGGLIEAYRKQLVEAQTPAETMKQMMELMNSPGIFATAIIMMLVLFFAIFTLPMIVGGAVAAKMLERGQTSV
ncbi:MAG: hypothetical protein FJW30_27505 [Acidobacteria bacterium]|nr:hypothetical protein [Acidobacteriota bacterium]